jgi:hypothetical protein
MTRSLPPALGITVWCRWLLPEDLCSGLLDLFGVGRAIHLRHRAAALHGGSRSDRFEPALDVVEPLDGNARPLALPLSQELS